MGKVRRVQNEEDGDSSDEDVVPTGMEVEIEFEARPPSGEDYDGIKTILSQALAKANVNLGGLADEIIARSGISQCLKQALSDEAEVDEEADEDDDETLVFGVCSVLSLTDAKREKPVDEVRNFLVSKCQDSAEPSTASKFLGLLESSRVGWILNERSSLPPTIAAPVIDAFLKDFESLRAKDPAYDFTHFLMICRVHQLSAGAKDDAEFWVNPEEKYFATTADCQFDFELDPSDDSEPIRRVILFPVPTLRSALEKFKHDLPALLSAYSGM